MQEEKRGNLMELEDSYEPYILDYFPNSKYQIREAQKKILGNIDSAAFLGKEYIIIQAPTGVGKSAITYTLLNFFKEGMGYVCTSRKALQTQYLNDFKDLKEAKGRSNYMCLESEGSRTCDKGNCHIFMSSCKRRPQKEETQYLAYYSNAHECLMYWTGPPEDPVRCPYMVDKVAAINHHAVISNYTYLLTEANYVGELSPREVLISDEGHNIEASIMDFVKVPISEEILDIVNKYRHDTPISFVNTDLYDENTFKLRLHATWLTDLNNAIIDVVSVIQKRAVAEFQEKQMWESHYKISHPVGEQKEEQEDRIQRIEKRLEDLYSDQQKLENLQNTQIKFFLKDIKDNLRNWVVMETRNSYDKVVKIEFQPIFISPYAQDKFFSLGRINIIMSATVLDYRIFAKNLGLPVEEVEYIEVEPQFPVENHPIFSLQIANFRYYEDDTPEDLDLFYTEIVDRIDMLLDLFDKDKGIIHCTSYVILEHILEKSKFKDRLITHDQSNREEKLEEHKNSTEPTVLCSPSMTEGVDLKDDLSRFQILVKVPFPDLKDERINKRKALDEDFYRFKTAMTIIQSIGRSVRSEKDYAVTFTLDSRFESFRDKNRDIMKLFNQHVKGNSELESLANLKDDNEFKRKITDPEFQVRLLKHIPRKQESNNEEISVNQDTEEE